MIMSEEDWEWEDDEEENEDEDWQQTDLLPKQKMEGIMVGKKKGKKGKAKKAKE